MWAFVNQFTQEHKIYIEDPVCIQKLYHIVLKALATVQFGRITH
jgi:hypothetical protein